MGTGSRTLFQDIFITTSDVPPRQRKGRSEELISKRNDCIIHRYYFLRRQTRWDYNSLIDEISNQFFLSAATITDIMMDNNRDLALLKKEYAADDKLTRLKKLCTQKWPHLVW